MNNPRNRIARSIIALVLLLLALARIIFFEFINERLDETTLILLALAIAAYFVPWNRLSTFKAAGLEVSIDAPQVSAAVDAIKLDRVDSDRLRQKIQSFAPLLPHIRGARVLWIDDKPHHLLGERRLLRALGVNITTALSSEAADAILQADNDFDLMITDVQRTGDTYKKTGGIEIHEGVNFIAELRKSDNPVIRAMPVIFYAAYDWARLQEFTRPARTQHPEPRITNSIDDLIVEAVRQLADSRTHPITVNAKKAPTAPR